MKSYCPNCGAGTEYSGPKPKFCSSCGNPFSALAKQENKNYKIKNIKGAIIPSLLVFSFIPVLSILIE